MAGMISIAVYFGCGAVVAALLWLSNRRAIYPWPRSMLIWLAVILLWPAFITAVFREQI